MIDLWSRYFTRILKAVRTAQEDGLANILKAILSAAKRNTENDTVDTKVAYDRVTAFLQRQGSPKILGSLDEFQKLYLENQQLRSVVRDINEIETKIQQATAPRDELQGLIRSMFGANKEIVFSDTSIEVTTSDNVPIGLKSLSSGEKQLVRILVETLMAGESTIMIDEPELSMHVDWQRQLVNAMQQLNPEAQLILATHSPEVMADISDDKIFRL